MTSSTKGWRMGRRATAAVLPARYDPFARMPTGAPALSTNCARGATKRPDRCVQLVDVATRLVGLLVEATSAIVRDVSVGFGSALIGRDACLLVAKEAIFAPRKLARAAAVLDAAHLGRATPVDVARIVVAVVMGARDSGSRE